MEDFPDHWVAVGSDERVIELRLSYVYDTHDPADGVTVHIPLGVLSRISAPQFSWNVPGLRHELIVAMIKALPKALRVQFVPAPDTATKIEDWIDSHFQTDPGSGTLDSPARVDGACGRISRTCSHRPPSRWSGRRFTRRCSMASPTSCRHTCA